MYQETVSEKQGIGEHCTTLECSGGHNKLKTINCLSTSPAGRCGKLTQTNVIIKNKIVSFRK